MPTFDSPTPIEAAVSVMRGNVRIVAGDVATTNVTVAPTDPSSDEDRSAAEHTRVDFAGGQLRVRQNKLRSWQLRIPGSIDVTVELPAGSAVRGSGAQTDFICDGTLGQCQVKTAMGDVSIDRASGAASISSSTGSIRVAELGSSAVIKNANGDTWIGDADGDLRVSGANGNISIEAAKADVVAKSARGDVRLGEALRGSVVLETSLGDVEIGIPEGTPAWLDVRSGHGQVYNGLEPSGAPDGPVDAVRVRARTAAGDVMIKRP